MFAVNKKTGAKIVGTAEALTGTAAIVGDSFHYLKEEKGIDFDYDGHTEIDWNDQTTKTDKKGVRLFVDDEGKICRETDIKLVDEDPEA